MSDDIRSLDLDDFGRLCGIDPADFPAQARQIAETRDFRYRPIFGADRDAVLATIVRRIIDGEMWVSGPDRRDVWETGWSENLNEYLKTGSLSALTPKFLKPEVKRLFGDYVYPLSPSFEFDAVDVFRHYLFETFLRDVEAIYEFGCGSCQHIPVYAALFPGRSITGLDWSEVSMEIIVHLIKDQGWPLQARQFDFFQPDKDFDLTPNAGVVTVGGLEQLGRQFSPMLDWVVAQKPRMVVNVETLSELYDPDSLLDYLALKYDRRRNYLDGYLTALRQRESRGEITIHRVFRAGIGSQYHDSYCFVAWSPV